MAPVKVVNVVNEVPSLEACITRVSPVSRLDVRQSNERTAAEAVVRFAVLLMLRDVRRANRNSLPVILIRPPVAELSSPDSIQFVEKLVLPLLIV